MGILDFIKGELLEIIEWTDDSRDTLSYRFPDEDKAIKRGAQLIVRESQVAQFVYLGRVCRYVRSPANTSLHTDNIPDSNKAQILEVWVRVAVQGGRLLPQHSPLHGATSGARPTRS